MGQTPCVLSMAGLTQHAWPISKIIISWWTGPLTAKLKITLHVSESALTKCATSVSSLS